MKIDKTHEIVGKTLSEIKSLDIGSLYPVLEGNQPESKIIGVFSAEFGTPEGCVLSDKLQAFVPVDLKAKFLIPLATIAGNNGPIALNWNGRNVVTDTGKTLDLHYDIKTEQQAREALVALYSGAAWEFEEIC